VGPDRRGAARGEASPAGGVERRRHQRRAEDGRFSAVQQELEAARRVSEVFFESQDSDEVIAKALVTAVDVVGAEGGSILIADPGTKELVFRHSIGTHPVPVGTTIPCEAGIAGLVFTSGESVIIDDVSHEAHHFKGIDLITDFVTRDMIAAPLRRWDGEPIGVLEVLNKRGSRFDKNDLTLLSIVSAISASAIERARLNEEAKLAEVAKLFGDISHDMKNLLTPVVYSSELLEEVLNTLFERLAKGDQEEQAHSYGQCRKVIASLGVASRRTQSRLKTLCDCLKGLSTEPRFAPSNIGGIVGEVFEALRPPAQLRNVTLASRGLEGLPGIVADEERLFNAFYNLVNNAIAAVPPGGAVTVSGEADPPTRGVVVSVADTGHGMTPEQCANLFTTHARSRKLLSSGLGTSIVKDVIDAHRGRIDVESAVGRGTTFRVHLPLNPSAAASR
jgi:signal transduction histidine kinase